MKLDGTNSHRLKNGRHRLYMGMARLSRRLLPGSIQGVLLLLLLIVLVPILIVQGALHYSSFQDQRTAEYESNLELARAVGTSFDSYVEGVLRLELTIGEALALPQPSSQAMKLLVDSAQQYSSINYLGWVDPQGRVTMATDPAATRATVNGRQYYEQILGGREWVVSNLLIGQVSGLPTFVIARGIRDGQGNLQGIVVATVNPDRLGDVLNVARAGNAAIYVVDSSGRLVYRDPATSLTWDQRDLLDREPPLKQALAGKETTGSFVFPLEGQVRMTGLSPVGLIGWVAGASVPESEAMAQVTQDLLHDFALLLGVSLAAFIAALWAARYLTEPMKSLRNHAIAVGHGQLEHRVALSGPQELEGLADAFNRMSNEIQGRERRLGQLLEEVQSRAAQLGATISSVADGMVIYDQHGTIVQMNPTAQRMLAYTETDRQLPIGERMEILRAQTGDGRLIGFRELPAYRALQGETVQGMVLLIHPVAGQETWISASAAPIVTEAGRLEGAVMTFTDITELHRLQEQHSDLLRAVSHDLRTPLTGILGHAQLLQRVLQRAELGEREQRSAEALVASARRMSRMIEELVDSARIESGNMQMNPVAVDLSVLLQDLQDRLSGAVDTSRIRIDLPEGLHAVMADSDRLDRIMTNLITNALKYSTPGTDVWIRAREAPGSFVEISVSDEGDGIAPEELPRLFDRYFRSSGTRKIEGLGLGLYITRMMVEAHGGRIWAESEVGVGSVFRFTLRTAI